MSKVSIDTRKESSNTYGRLALAAPILREMHHNRPESAEVLDVHDWCWDFLHLWAELDRYETSVEVGREPVAYGVSAVLHDPHVGNTLSVEVSYSLEPGAGTHL